MSFESLTTLRVEPRHRAPRQADTRLAGLFAKTIGCVVLALCAVFVVSLLTWSANDPSLTHLSTAKPRNWLGPVGAILSDLVLNTLGLAGVFALLPPVYWATELLTKNGVQKIRTKLILAPFAVLCIAAFLSGLPRAGLWSVPTGYGGLLGDFAFNILSSTLATLNAERAGLAAGISCMAAGVALLMVSLGLRPADVKAMAQQKLRSHEPDSSWVASLKKSTLGPLSAVGSAALTADAVAMARSFSHAPDLTILVSQVGELHAMQAAPLPAIATAVAHAAVTPSSTTAPLMTPAYAPAMRSNAPRPYPMEPVSAQRAVPAPSTALPTTVFPSVAAALHDHQLQPTQRAAATPAIATPRPVYRLPAVTLLPRSSAPRSAPSDLHIAEKLKGERLKSVLAAFAIVGELRGHICGPVVTIFNFEPAAGTRSARIIGLADDIARGLGVRAVRIQLAPGRTSLAIEVPHTDPVRIGLRDLVEHDTFKASDLRIPLALGATAAGEPCVADLVDLPHVLVAGQDQRLRSDTLNSLFASVLYRLTPETAQLVLAGSALTPFVQFNGLPHLAHPVGTTAAHGLELLTNAAAAIDDRTLRMRSLAQAQSIEDYNARLREARRRSGVQPLPGDMAILPYLIVGVADLADLAALDASATAQAIHKIARFGRAAGVHLIAATSRIDDAALPAELRAAFNTRLVLGLASKAESRSALGEVGAEDLLGDGDMLVITGSDTLKRGLGGGQLPRLHGALMPSADMTRVAAAAMRPGVDVIAPVVASGPPAARPDVAPFDTAPQWTRHSGEARSASTRATNDALYDRAVSLVRREQSAQPNVLHRQLNVSYGEALDLLEQMAKDRVVSAADDEGTRTVLIGRAA